MSETPSDQSSLTAVLLERDGRYFFYQPGLAVIASGENVEGAYDKFLGARRSFIQEVESAGLSANRVPVPVPLLRRASQARRESVGRELGLFLIKTFIVLLIVGGISLAAALGVKRSMTQLISSAGALAQALAGGQSTFLGSAKSLQKISLVDIVSKAAQHAEAMPQERKEQLRQSIGILSREAEPLIEAWQRPPPLPGRSNQPELPPASAK